MFMFKRKDHPFDEAHLRTSYDGTRSRCIQSMLRRTPVELRTPAHLEDRWDLYEVGNGCTKIDMATDSQTKRWVTIHGNFTAPIVDNFPPNNAGN